MASSPVANVLNRLRQQPRLPNGRWAARPSREQRQENAEKRSLALLRALVDPGDWDSNLSNPIQVETESAVYEIRFTGMVENISFRFKSTTPYGNQGGRICGGPYLWSDYSTPASMHRSRLPRVDDELWSQAMRLEGRQPLPIPMYDFYLGQYLGLKFNETQFLAKSVVAYTRY